MRGFEERVTVAVFLVLLMLLISTISVLTIFAKKYPVIAANSKRLDHRLRTITKFSM